MLQGQAPLMTSPLSVKLSVTVRSGDKKAAASPKRSAGTASCSKVSMLITWS